MWPEITDFLRILIAVVLCCGAVKLADDYLDREHDRAVRRINWADKLGAGTMLYAMLLLSLAAVCDPQVSLSLFFASYITGMFHDLGRLFPSRLSGWEESLILLALGGIFWGWRLMLLALTFIAGLQLIDDCLDQRLDRLSGQRNFARSFGTVECLLLAAGFLLFDYWLDAVVFPPVLIGTTLFYFSTAWQERRPA